MEEEIDRRKKKHLPWLTVKLDSEYSSVDGKEGRGRHNS